MRLWRRDAPVERESETEAPPVPAPAESAEAFQPEDDDTAAPRRGGEREPAAAGSLAHLPWWQRHFPPPPAAAPETQPPQPPEDVLSVPEPPAAAPTEPGSAEPEPVAQDDRGGEEAAALHRPSGEIPSPEAQDDAGAPTSTRDRWGWLRRRPQSPDEAAPDTPVATEPETPAGPEPPDRGEAPGGIVAAVADAEAALVPEASADAAEAGQRGNWFTRLRAGLARSSARLNDGINAIFNRRRLDDEALEELEELLISSDMGLGLAGEVTESLRRTRFNQEVAPEEIRLALAEQVIRLVEPVTRPLRVDRDQKPFVILVVGVNGSGKTTTIAKLARQYRDQGMAVVLAAGDTFRAAAVEQLQVWGERTGCRVVARPNGADAAGLAYDAFLQARTEGADILLIDTAGRLHNKSDLMGELQKIVRVLKKVEASAPHSVLLVLDATTGQNAHAQAEIFREMVGVTGIVMTKLDGTARGGVLVSLAEKYGIPIHAIGVGESAYDLRPFEARAYARSLVGLEP